MPLIPVVAIVILKVAWQKGLDRKISEGAVCARDGVAKLFSMAIRSLLSNIVFNTTILLVAILILPLFFSREVTLVSVCTVYMLSLSHGIYSLLRRIPVVCMLIKELIKERFNLYEVIHKEIYSRALKEASSSNIFVRIGNFFFGKSEEDIAHDVARQTSALVKNIVIRGCMAIVTIVIYIAIFRLLVAPALVKDVTGMGPFLSAIYPLLMSFDYFFSTDFLSLKNWNVIVCIDKMLMNVFSFVSWD